MSSRGQSLSMFVVQRTFTRVRRGYDPDEVDRHLELVSRWFTSTDAGRAIAEEPNARDAELVVVGARRGPRKPFSHTVETVLKRSSCRVLVIAPPPEAAAARTAA
jgi:DivIVA domain-containing protein